MLFAAGVACLAWRFLSLLALLVLLVVVCQCWRCLSCSTLFAIVGVAFLARRCLPLLALLVALVRFLSLTRFPFFACPVGGWVGGVALIKFPGG